MTRVNKLPARNTIRQHILTVLRCYTESDQNGLQASATHSNRGSLLNPFFFLTHTPQK